MSAILTETSSKERSPESAPFTSPLTMHNATEGFYDITLSSSVPICRICHCSSEEEDLIQPCRCRGSVGYAHQSCIRKWIVGSTISSCELCNYKFKMESRRILDIRKLQFPRPSFKGWLHVFLFLAFFSIMLTSMTWIMWSQFSSSRAAQSERESKEITYAYGINAGFIIMALIGLYLDSFGQCRSYYRRWSLLNHDLVIFPYEANEDVDYCNKTAGLSISSHNTTVNTSPTFNATETCAASTPNTSPDKSKNIETRGTTSTFSYENDGFSYDIEILGNPMDSHFINMSRGSVLECVRRQSPVTEVMYVVPNNSIYQNQSLNQSKVVPADFPDILVLKETYV